MLVPGNHDFRLISPWLEWRSRNGPEPLGLQERAGPKASIGTRAIARMVQPASLDVVYPGIWLDDGVYATHGHYLDRHVTVPSFERLGSGVLGRLLRAPADQAGGPDDYEVALAPMYAPARRDRRPRRRRARRRAGQDLRAARGSGCPPTAAARRGGAACSPAPSR